jgi:hypothetical protein
MVLIALEIMDAMNNHGKETPTDHHTYTADLWGIEV